MGKSNYRKKLDWDDMSYGEAQHHNGKKTNKTKKDFKRKSKYKNNWEDDLDY